MTARADLQARNDTLRGAKTAKRCAELDRLIGTLEA